MEKISGKDMNRPKLQEMRGFTREGDTVYIHDFSRLARRTAELLALTEKFDACYEKYLSDRSYSKSQIAKELRVSRPTIDKLIQEKIKAVQE